MIDETTGLPELPEGHRWMVRKQKGVMPSFGWGVHTYDTGKIEAAIESHWTSTTTTEGKRRWFRPGKPVTKVDEGWSDASLASPVEVHGLHPIAIRNAANRALRLWNEAKTREELLGAYRPKKLVA